MMAIPATEVSVPSRGVTVIGDLNAAIGLSEAGRLYADAMTRRGIPLEYAELPYKFHRRMTGPKPEWLRRMPRGCTHDINLLIYSFAELFTIEDSQLLHFTRGQYTIGLWFWEMSHVPLRLQPQFERVDELWVASRYTRLNLQMVTRTPITTIPVPIEVSGTSAATRATFGLPENRFVFLYTFGAASSDARKNPFGVLQAFEGAFGAHREDGPLLVLKTHHLDFFPQLREALKAEVARLGGVLLEESYSREEMNDLLACADCYVSLHRSEGFGLGMAESMYLGKPVIATYYSGNADFMTPHNSFPVGCALRPVAESDHGFQPHVAHVYEPGQLWAEPDLEQASWWMRYVYTHGEDARQRGAIAAADIRRYCSPDVVGQRIEERLTALRRDGVQTRRQRVAPYTHGFPSHSNRAATADYGLHIVGDMTVDAGLGTAARSITNAIVQQGIPVAYTEIAYPFERKAEERELMRSLPGLEQEYAFNLLHFNFAELSALVSPEKLAQVTGGRYTIGFWFWELPRVPRALQPQFERVDEIWVASNYTKGNLQMVTRRPVTVIPVPVQVTVSPSIDRSFYGIPPDRFVFLYSFSAASSIGRKNPWAILDAFEAAFSPCRNSGPLLVLKGHHADLFPELVDSLQERIERLGGLLLNESYSRQQMNDLLACADCYVSLHRSEGFGLGMAESMYLGKPVIATYYSANSDYMTPQNSFPVGCHLRPITSEDHEFQPDVESIYEPGQLWAEPHIEQAAEWMRYVYENREAARRHGQQAAVDIQRYCSPQTVGQRIEERLVTLYRASD